MGSLHLFSGTGESFGFGFLLASLSIRLGNFDLRQVLTLNFSSLGSGDLHALPIMLELDDVHALWDRHVALDRYERLLVESATQLTYDGAQNARTLVLHVHPWLMGQPFRIGTLDRALGAMLKLPGLTAARASDVIAWAKEAS